VARLYRDLTSLTALSQEGSDYRALSLSTLGLVVSFMNRGPIILTIDEAEYLLDQIPPPSANDDELLRNLRRRLSELLVSLRAGAEGSALAP